MFARYPGGISSTLSSIFEILGKISFSRNDATFFGGAISLTDPSELYIADTSFESNRGTSGGAVYLTSTVATTGGFERCRFTGNNASSGGAAYFSTNFTAEPRQARFVQDSVFLLNDAGERSLTECMVWDQSNRFQAPLSDISIWVSTLIVW